MTADNIFVRPKREQRRVVVTGVGAVTPVGLSVNESWENLLAGKSGIAAITQFDAASFDVRFAGEVKGFNPDDYINKKDQKKMDRFIQLSLGAAKMAMADSGISISPELSQRVGTIVGVGIGGLPMIE